MSAENDVTDDAVGQPAREDPCYHLVTNFPCASRSFDASSL